MMYSPQSAGVARGAAAAENDAVDGAQLRIGHLEAAELGCGFLAREPAAHGVADRSRLLVDLLEHVMRVVALAHILLGEIDLADLEAAGAAEERGDFKLVAPECGDVVVLQVHGLPGVRDDGAHVAGEEVLALPEPEHERAAAPRADDRLRHIAVQHEDAVGADALLQGRAHRLDQPRPRRLAARRVKLLADQVREHFGVGLRMKGVAFAGELLAQGGVVFNHAIVAEHELAALVGVRVRVLIGHTAVGGPAGVRDADGTGRRRLLDQLGEAGDAADAFADFDLPLRQRRHPRRIVAAIFQPAQSIEKDGDCGFAADVADDAAHDK